ncbi:hypothetical protein ES703_93838 [subsurface metagenome]
MALIKHGALVAQISGSVAGTTFARNRYGAYARNRTKPVNPNTALQNAQRAALTLLTARWAQTLTGAQRTAWNLYGSNVVMLNKLGENINLTGFNHYIRSNTGLIRTGHGTLIVDDGPVIFELPATDPTLAVTGSEGTQDLTISFDNTLPWAMEDPGWLYVYQGSPQNAQRNFFAGPWKFALSVVGILGGGVVEPQVVPATFAIAEGQRQWIYARILRADGRISQKFRADTFIAA